MTILITGDIHARTSLDKLLGMNFDSTGLTKDDYLVICGDFGLVWDSEEDKGWHAELNENTLDWLEAKPWTTLFVDGNHENHDRLAAYDVETWHGGHVHKIRPSVIHLMRGEMFEIDGKSFFCMGGAASVDKDSRVEGKSWWAAEIPSDDEREHAIDTLESHGWSCDYVLTHDCPANVKFDLGCRVGATYSPDAWSEWLQMIADKLEFSQWFFGHYHEDYKHIGIGGKYTVLFDYIYDLGEDDWSDRMTVPRVCSYEQLPESENSIGYSIAEIAEIANVTEQKVDIALQRSMRGSTVGIGSDGEIRIYKCDVFRVLDWC